MESSARAELKPAAELKFSLEYKRPGFVSQFFITLLVRRLIPFTFGILRRFAPVFRFPFTNTVLVTSFDYVQEVFQRHNDFPVPYQRQVDLLDWKPTFLLAMKDTPAYWETMDQVRQLWNEDDLAFVRQIAKETSEAELDKAEGQIDAIQGLMIKVTEAVILRYYGVPIPENIRPAFFDACMQVAGFLFGSQSMAPKAVQNAQAAIAVVWQVIDAAIAEARKTPLPDNTVIGRCHANNITDDAHLRSYLMGMIMGFLPTNTLANGHALSLILNNSDAYGYAMQAADGENYELMLSVVYEALRISYILPGLWRTVPEATEIGIGTDKTYKLDRGRMIYISGLSAMLDSRRIKNPYQFNPDRSRDVYLIYGYHFHFCVGAAIADSMMEEIFMALMRRKPKQKSKMTFNGNFPWTYELTYKC